ncbi:uncharacterized protein STEHIDRAFT_111129 [Stereum hirsutum FP-91666 SS1]|uniref:uncharacterized protein n=1 Tax=Stereum hirsutum (strain FP-91666) TaxID=721885 RepID=UPI000440FD94|nr:uncharacterized protein STEHIDRAFT_111129 [Stereum hirsutum FP-91666 SS1]EIM86673.1 hypothetical protein STEHIDRAFT_111129 [Stereum hirsutum FP-91666 SS1]
MSTPIIKGTSISGDGGVESDCVPPPPGHIDLSQIEYHPWPACFVAAVSKLLDNAGIPNVLWGDLLHWWRGCRHIPQTRVYRRAPASPLSTFLIPKKAIGSQYTFE